MADITKEKEQTDEKSPPNEEYRPLRVPRWISTKIEIDINSTDDDEKVLLWINKNVSPVWRPWDSKRERKIHINFVSMGDCKPILASIGPFHLDTIKPDAVNVHKLRYLRDFVERTNTIVEELLRDCREQFHQYFLFKCNYSNDQKDPFIVFLKTWILDGCFIIELFLKNDKQEEGNNKREDVLFESERVLYALSRDLILPNNQMSIFHFKVLIQVSEKLSEQESREKLRNFCRLARTFLQRIVPNQKLYQLSDDNRYELDQDLRSIVYDGLNWKLPDLGNDDVEVRDDKWNLVQSATELEEFGVEFKMIDRDNFVGITFTNKGVLEIPLIRIRYGTPYCIKVLLEYEQSHRESKCLNDYLWFMNSLVKSPNDVQLLRQKGIIDNLSELPDDAAIHKFLKNLYESLMISPTNFSYIQVCRDLNSHCKHRRNRWMAKLRRDYFNSPWAIISFFAASLLLILTLAQTVFSATSYNNQG